MLDILGGLREAVTGVVHLYPWVRRKWRRRHFDRVFGAKTNEYFLAFGIMAVRSELLARALPELARFPLAKPSRPELAFSAQRVASSCEIRAVAYVVPMLTQEAGIQANVVTDEVISEKLDLDFISFGALSNLKTRDAFKNPSNDLVEYDLTLKCFVSKTNHRPLHQNRRGCDYGIILKIHPNQFPGRTWIVCAGNGEWGTSGAAYFLAKRWREIAAEVEQDTQFVSLIEVDENQDESTRLLALCKTPAETVAISLLS